MFAPLLFSLVVGSSLAGPAPLPSALPNREPPVKLPSRNNAPNSALFALVVMVAFRLVGVMTGVMTCSTPAILS